MLSETLRSRWFSACVHAGLWVLLLLVVTRIGGRRPPFEEARPDPAAVVAPVPVARLENLFAAVKRPPPAPPAGALSPFVTAYFQPAAPPPPPTTRKVELTYQGYYQTGDAPPRALIRFGDALVSVPVGGSALTNLWVAGVTATNLTLTNAVVAGQTNLLLLNTKKEIEIPIR